MMTDKPVSVYRLLPSTGQFRTLSLEEYAHRKLIRWLRTGSPEDLPDELHAEWVGNPRLRPAEFPCGYPGAPVFSSRIVDSLQEGLRGAGKFLRVVPEETGKGDGREYHLYAVDKVVDCVDARRSSKPKKGTGQMKTTFFRPDALPADLPAFRVPDHPGAVHWNGWAVDRLTELLGDDLEARLIWSEDPSLTPHPDPWGF
ncbi:hypothetical protein KUF83_17580 [Streptomyces sp. BV286]|uniref:hypothetical protein n=1 Tax=Streptomyces sp. BV286 TaxID=2849672 RepID=UPI001C2E32EA|nr:hypothetical protein [Streptomyces sp. BV286]MBV1938360.1 hypothetical protein [Streptomyces sp. BV286]